MAKVRSSSKQMRGKQVDGESISGYFRGVFNEKPELLKARSNDDLLERWLKDHPGVKVVPDRVKQNLANIKSVLRKKARKRKTLAKGLEQPVAARPTTGASVSRGLESLEENIDNCLDQARNLDSEGLADIIQLLRRARNGVVWKMGQ
jgi:hypothetical protein